MPLTRSTSKAPFVNLNLVEFSMADATTRASVACKVSEDALRKLIGKGTSITPLAALFDKYRSEIENIASEKYDRGDASPHVREVDV